MEVIFTHMVRITILAGLLEQPLVEKIYVYSDGDERSLEDITIAGAYYVYINHL